jgi:5,10-methylenetetrahydrofolate reductase
LALTGDSAKMSDQPLTKGVFEDNSLLLLNIINSFNNGMDYAGKPFLQKPKNIISFAVINSYAKNFKTLEKKMNKKIRNKTLGIITQPIYDIQNAKQLLKSFENAKSEFKDERKDTQLILGIFPITKLRTAQFLSSNVPGIYVPNNWIDSLAKASRIGIEEEYKVGMDLSKDLFKEIQSCHPKVHIMLANQFDTMQELLNL